jgi:hypothetical protein
VFGFSRPFGTARAFAQLGTSGPNEVSADIVTFDPQTGVTYMADHVNDGALAINTHTWTVLGVVSPPLRHTIENRHSYLTPGDSNYVWR